MVPPPKPRGRRLLVFSPANRKQSLASRVDFVSITTPPEASFHRAVIKTKNPLAGVIVLCLILDPADVEIRGVEPLTS